MLGGGCGHPEAPCSGGGGTWVSVVGTSWPPSHTIPHKSTVQAGRSDTHSWPRSSAPRHGATPQTPVLELLGGVEPPHRLEDQSALRKGSGNEVPAGLGTLPGHPDWSQAPDGD